MESSRKAVESYWRSRMIDAATSDEDKVTPVYKLEEICELLRSSHVSIVKEVSEFVLKRLEHKSPIVKQKALRLIKYAVGKSGTEFRREMQRHSVAVRPLSHYKGQLDPLKGDSLNKAVRDTANEVISAIFSTEDSKPEPADDVTKRIQGFGNTNYEMPSEDKKSFLSEVVGLGSASIKQGISSFTQGHTVRKTDNSSYKRPNLRSSLTTETENSERYTPVELRNENQGSAKNSKFFAGGAQNYDSGVMTTGSANGGAGSSSSESKTREERLLDTIVTSGGVRLQPTRDAIQAFLLEASKLDALALSHALEVKLRSLLWQVRMKAVCVLEAILRRREAEPFSSIASYFCENKEVVIQCFESPQSSLKEKANRVLGLMGDEQGGTASNFDKSSRHETAAAFQMPDLIDTGNTDEFLVTRDLSLSETPADLVENLTTTSPPMVDDLFGNDMSIGASSSEQNNDDPFADVAFRTNEGNEHVNDLFSGMTIGDDSNLKNGILPTQSGSKLLDIFDSNSGFRQEQVNPKSSVNDLIGDLSSSGNISNNAKGDFAAGFSDLQFSSDPVSRLNVGPKFSSANAQFSTDPLSGMNTGHMFPPANMQYIIPPGMMLNPAFGSLPINYGAMGNFFTQQQLLAAMSNIQQQAQNAGFGNLSAAVGGSSSPLPDIFQPNLAPQMPISTMNSSKKEDSRAFDFISDHMAAARDPRKVG